MKASSSLSPSLADQKVSSSCSGLRCHRLSSQSPAAVPLTVSRPRLPLRTRATASGPSSLLILLLLSFGALLLSDCHSGFVISVAEAFSPPRSSRSANSPASAAAARRAGGAAAPESANRRELKPPSPLQSTPDGECEARMSPLRRLVLVGGGHGHVQVIKALNRSARPRNLRVTLIDMQEDASYSGMVPGCVSGLYSREQTLIRLRPLAEWAGIDFVRDEVVDVDPVGKRLYLRGGEDVPDGQKEENCWVDYDAVSFDIGSASRGLDETPGALEHCIPTRPISDLVRRIDEAGKELKEKIRTGECGDDGAHVVVVGGGAAGIELSMAMRARWGPLFDDGGEDEGAEGTRPRLQITLLDSGDELLPAETSPCREALRNVLARRGVDVRHSSSVREITPASIVLDDGTELPCTHCLWATGAAAHPLADVMGRRGVATTARGWIRVSPTLQSVSHPGIFAAGDCCQIEGLEGNRASPPKAGVYAVRSGPILIENLTRYLKKKSKGDEGDEAAASDDMISYVPQDDFLKLVMCGDGTALGFRFGLPLEGKWVWDLKDKIDTMFMDLFDAEKLPPLEPPPQDAAAGGGSADARQNGEEGEEDGEYDTAQYDAAEEKWDSLPAGEAAELLGRTDDNVNYEEAWHVLRDMMGDDSYRDAVLEAVAARSSEEKEAAPATTAVPS